MGARQCWPDFVAETERLGKTENRKIREDEKRKRRVAEKEWKKGGREEENRKEQGRKKKLGLSGRQLAANITR